MIMKNRKKQSGSLSDTEKRRRYYFDTTLVDVSCEPGPEKTVKNKFIQEDF